MHLLSNPIKHIIYFILLFFHRKNAPAKPERHPFSILNYLKHLLRHRFLLLLLNLCLCLSEVFQPFQFFLSIIKSDMRVHIHCNRYIRMSHQILQGLGIHSRFRHIATIGVSAHMGRDVWHLHPIDIIVPADHVVESVLPVHCHKGHSIVIVKQESAISIYGFLHFRCISVLDDCLKHLCHILCDWQYSCSGIRLCGFYDISHIRCSLQL